MPIQRGSLTICEDTKLVIGKSESSVLGERAIPLEKNVTVYSEKCNVFHGRAFFE